MTTANKITLLRLFAIPFFVGFALYYSKSLEKGTPIELYRYLAIFIFLLASLSDAIDGFIARKFKQQSKFGLILDPLVDKALLLSALLSLSFAPWNWPFPIWFPVLVVARDIAIVGGVLFFHFTFGKVTIKPHWTGKIATCAQMVTLAYIMFNLPSPILLLYFAGFFTLLSGIFYLIEGIRQSHVHE